MSALDCRRPLSRQFNFFFLSFSYLGGCFEDLEGEVLAGETAAAAATDGEGTERALRGRGGEAARRIPGMENRMRNFFLVCKELSLEVFHFSFSKLAERVGSLCLRLCFASPLLYKIRGRTQTRPYQTQAHDRANSRTKRRR